MTGYFVTDLPMAFMRSSRSFADVLVGSYSICVVFFPTLTPDLDRCGWLSLHPRFQ